MYHSRPVELLLACCLLAWGVTMLQPEEMFARPAYQYMRDLAPESRWGMVAILVASMRFFALYVNGWWRRTPLLRCFGSGVGGLFWLSIAFLMWAASRHHAAELPAGMAYYPIFLVAEGWCVYRTGYDMHIKNSLAWR